MSARDRLNESSAELRAIRVVEGDEREVTNVVATLRRAGCVVESVVKLGADTWEITARSHD